MGQTDNSGPRKCQFMGRKIEKIAIRTPFFWLLDPSGGVRLANPGGVRPIGSEGGQTPKKWLFGDSKGITRVFLRSRFFGKKNRWFLTPKIGIPGPPEGRFWRSSPPRGGQTPPRIGVQTPP